ncbi:MAG: 2-amino-4-hydroxy-6-hydroxymethyldihydropteridine diphosphokinase [Deltaproteobacteria bacterium]|nr:2-amino-4-hydroxy-6-hydroxymethyldihydropteridine diphosphokinase [Deltaproteobacteria bacterium]MBW1960969.1 2-amino-4-hydroxy-6-hydroxymethyldihydropteridine diphosphokinase [Deltaproteobacteria bacterium]MBW2151532.1 2-amino-4-hydroxy-6-hydroxymethyldihydropteridine diphosphokinase [Deltaproteobacteria bacterium]
MDDSYPDTSHIVYISVGSNLGVKRLNCQRGISALTDTGKVTLLNQSPFYKTEPVDYTDQHWFVNCVIQIKTELSPEALLNTLKRIEKDAGRNHDSIRFGPRVLDMDIVFYDDLVLVSSELIIPHPRMHKRRFVLKPICDIDSKIVHPVLKKTVQTLLDGLDADTQRVVACLCAF